MRTIDLTTPLSWPVDSTIDSLPAISLRELNRLAALQNRVDRKYVVDANELASAIGQLSNRLAVLDIDGRRTFGYESVYFDTVDLRSFFDAARSRRRRFKVRTRTYLDSGDVMLEVKRRDGRGRTIKKRRPHSSSADVLDSAAVDFIDSQLDQPGLGVSLQPTLTTSYRRTTVVDLDGVARVTIDGELQFGRPGGQSDGLDDRLVLETKSSGRPSAMDRTLWQLGIRPSKISKYGTGLAVLDPTLPANKWHRTIRRHMGPGGPGPMGSTSA